jgi:OOP family OmpA-OmpF porin
MKKNVFLTGLMIMMLSLCTSCALHTYHFGVQDRAYLVPDDFGETEVAIAQAERSEGAKYCPEKLEKAKELAHRGAEVYWQCRNTESSDLLAQARAMAKEAEGCRPATAAPAPPPPAKSTAPVCKLNISPSTVNKGDSATLSWSSKDANRCDIQPGIGPVDTQGSMAVNPEADTTYTLTCFGKGGQATSDASVAVATPKQEECMLLKIEFDFDKAVIKPQYFSEVEKVANFLKEHPESTGVIEGHTDSIGGAAYNMGLSQRRAESVVNMLVEKYGIAASRLTAKGYGLTKPIASNKTKEGRQRNRRVMAKFCY